MNSSPISAMSSTVARTGQLRLPNLALVGKAGSGKSTAAELLCSHGVILDITASAIRYERLSFAAPLKQIAVQLWGESAATDREKLQKLGMGIREIESNTWTNLALREIADTRDVNSAVFRPVPLVIDDCRFENEWWALKGEGFVTVRITADRPTRIDRLKANGKFQTEEQLDHSSETAIDHLEADYNIVNDGSTMDLYAAIVERVILKEARK